MSTTLRMVATRWLLAVLMGGVVCGAGTGLLMPFRKISSLKEIVPSVQKRLALVSVVLYLLFTILITAQIVFSNLRIAGL